MNSGLILLIMEFSHIFQLIIDELNQDYNLDWKGYRPKEKILYSKRLLDISNKFKFPPIPTQVVFLSIINRIQFIRIIGRLKREKMEILRSINFKNIADQLINPLDGKERKYPWIISHFEETKFSIEIDKADPQSRKDFRIIFKDAYPVYDIEIGRYENPDSVPQIVSFGYAGFIDTAISAYFTKIENNESEFRIHLLESKIEKFNK